MLSETLAPFRTSWDKWDISAHFELHRHHPYLWLWFSLYFPANGHLTLAWCCSLPASFWQPPLLSSSALPAIASHILSTVLHILEAGPFVHYLSDIMVKLWNQVYTSITGFSLLFSIFLLKTNQQKIQIVCTVVMPFSLKKCNFFMEYPYLMTSSQPSSTDFNAVTSSYAKKKKTYPSLATKNRYLFGYLLSCLVKWLLPSFPTKSLKNASF